MVFSVPVKRRAEPVSSPADETTWSHLDTRLKECLSGDRCQRISVALHTAVAWVLATAYEPRSHTVANDPRGWVAG